MWFFTRILIFFAIVVLLEFYYFRRTKKSFLFFFKEEKLNFYKYFRNLFLFMVNGYPVFMICYYFYSQITGVPFSRTIDGLWFDILLVFPFWISALTIVQTILFILLVDIFKFVSYWILPKFRENFQKVYSVSIALIISVFVLYVPLRVLYDYNAVDITNVDYVQKNVPANLDGFKIALISDLQADDYTDDDRFENYIQKTNNQNPDLILIAGDLITSGPDFIKKSSEMAGKLNAKYGVYSCVGDHDNWAYRGNIQRSLFEITSAYAEVGIPIINNDTLTIDVDGSKIGIAFITNTYSGFINSNKLEEVTSSLTEVDFRIFLTHQIRDFLINKAIEKDFNLYLGGHTHGGQITVLFPFKNLSPTLWETPYVKGSFYFDDMLLQVCGGLGFSLVPMRYNSTPEIVVITLKNNSQ